MAGLGDFFSGNHRKLGEILGKIVAFQRSLPDDRPIELDELVREGVLSPEDIDFMSANEVKYKPHRRSDYHTMDMLQMKTGSGCLFTGPAGAPSTNRRARLSEFQSIVHNFLLIPRPKDELLLHIQLAQNDGMGVSPGFLSFTLRSDKWRARLDFIRAAATELGVSSFQDNEVQGRSALSYRTSVNAEEQAAVVMALLGRGCGLTDNAEIVYSAGALDEA